MSENWNFIFQEMFSGSINLILNLLKVLVPLFIIIELLTVFKVMERIAKLMEPAAKLMGMSKNAMLPLLVGVVMGVTYGAGVLMEMNEKNPLSKKDFTLVGIFIFICHGIIETGFLFAVAGANIWIVVGLRLLIAIVITIILARTPYIKKM
ncbi:MAG: nucleoside recognition domain-containing protein [Anaerovoracaceae bacterium]